MGLCSWRLSRATLSREALAFAQIVLLFQPRRTRTLHIWGSMPSRFARLAFARAKILVGLFLIFGACFAAATAWASTIEDLSIPSAALGRALPVAVYRPDGAPPPGGWPVLYLLHGLNGGYRDWPTLGGVQTTLDR